MESWSYVSGGRGFASDDSVSAPAMFAKGKNGSMDWELKTPFYNTNMLSSNQVENQGSVELGFPETMRKSLASGSIRDVLGSNLGGVRMFNPLTENDFCGEEESSSKITSSVVQSNCRDSALIDLNLGRFGDQRDTQNISSFRTTPYTFSTESCIPAKRLRAGGLSSLTPYCQVHGCKKDLSSCKDYHKRHKVCEVHSKTSKVIVNGIEQRFCQQCSRFHLLSEFDDGKRSCRKRLAGHNERRRKPHLGSHSSRTGRFYQSYNGKTFHGAAVTASSFICQGILPSGLPNSAKYDPNNWYRNIKLEEGTDYSSQSAITMTNGELRPKSILPYALEKNCPPTHKNVIQGASAYKFNGNSNGYLFQNNSLGGEECTVFDSPMTFQALSGISNAGHALSLLSSQSQNSSSHTSGISMCHPLIIPGGHEHYSVTQVSDKLLTMGQQTSTSGLLNKLQSPGINSVEVSHLSPILVTSDAVNFGIDGMLHGSEYMNNKDHLSSGNGHTIDLLQLSSQLQRVEHQREYLPLKHEDDAFCGLRIT